MPRLYAVCCTPYAALCSMLCSMLRSHGAQHAMLTTIHVSVSGDDSGAGTEADPLASCRAAVERLPAAAAAGRHVLVKFGAGTFVLNSSTACGSVQWNSNSSSSLSLTFAGDPAGGTHFDASNMLDAALLQPVTEPRITQLLNPAAKSKLLVMSLPSRPKTLEWDRRPLFSSVWPNPGVGTGFAYVRKVLDRGSYYFRGRSSWPEPHVHVCMGDNKSTIASPCGGNISLAQQPTGNWVAEMAAGAGFGALTVVGYLANVSH